MKAQNRLRLTLLVSAVLLFTFPSLAQIATVTDNTCTAANQCAGQAGHGCNSTNFTLNDVTNSYDLTASIDGCTGGSTACTACLTEAYIYTSGGTFVTCIHGSCGSSCDKTVQTLTLAGGNYILYCCKIDCTGDDCSRCPDTCVSRATIAYH